MRCNKLIAVIIPLLLQLIILTFVARSNLQNSEGIEEVKLVALFVQYLRTQAIQDDDGKPLESKYFVDDSGEHYRGDLQIDDIFNENSKQLRDILQKGERNHFINANRLRRDLSENPLQLYDTVWRIIARDMIKAIRLAQLPDKESGEQFRQVFVGILNKWNDVISERSQSIKCNKWPDEKHLAVLKAHLESFLQVRNELAMKLNEILQMYPDEKGFGYHLPQPYPSYLVDSKPTDYIPHQFNALSKYSALRNDYINGAKDESLRERLIDVLPFGVDKGFYPKPYEKDESEKPRSVRLNSDGSEIDTKYLVASSDPVVRQYGTDPTNERLRRLDIWKRLYKSVELLSTYKMISSSTLDERICCIFKELTLSISERAIALNARRDEDISEDMLQELDFHQEHFNDLIDGLRKSLPEDKLEMYRRLMDRLSLQKTTDGGIYRLKVKHESLRVSAERLFDKAIESIEKVGDEFTDASKRMSIANVLLDEPDSMNCKRDRIRVAFDQLREPIGERLRSTQSARDDLQAVVDAFADFATYAIAFTIKDNNLEALNLVELIIAKANSALHHINVETNKDGGIRKIPILATKKLITGIPFLIERARKTIVQQIRESTTDAATQPSCNKNSAPQVDQPDVLDECCKPSNASTMGCSASGGCSDDGAHEDSKESSHSASRLDSTTNAEDVAGR